MQYDFILTTGKCHVKSRDTQGEQQPADVRGKCWKDIQQKYQIMDGWSVQPEGRKMQRKIPLRVAEEM